VIPTWSRANPHGAPIRQGIRTPPELYDNITSHATDKNLKPDVKSDKGRFAKSFEADVLRTTPTSYHIPSKTSITSPLSVKNMERAVLSIIPLWVLVPATHIWFPET
jgi:hypothetical protein